MDDEYESYNDYILSNIKISDSTMIHESPDGGNTIRSRPSADHPIHLLTNGKLPIDIWYKVFKND